MQKKVPCHTQPLPTRLHDGAVAVALADRNVFSGLDEGHPLHPALANGDEITIMGESAIGASNRNTKTGTRLASPFHFYTDVNCR